MKRAFSLMLVFLLLFVAGCVNDDDDDDDKDADNNTGGVTTTEVQASDYYPLTNGTQWNYTATGTERDEPFTKSYVNTVGGTEEMAGNTYNVMISGDDSTLVRIDNNIIYTNNYFLEDVNEAAMKAVPAAKAAISAAIAEVEDIAWFDFNKSVGSSWTLFENVSEIEGAISTLKITGKRVGTEDVTVPSGTYRDCPKFAMTLTNKYTYTSDGATFEVEYRSILTVWFGYGVGIVKNSEEGSENTPEDNTMEKVFSSVSMLDSYHIAE